MASYYVFIAHQCLTHFCPIRFFVEGLLHFQLVVWYMSIQIICLLVCSLYLILVCVIYQSMVLEQDPCKCCLKQKCVDRIFNLYLSASYWERPKLSLERIEFVYLFQRIFVYSLMWHGCDLRVKSEALLWSSWYDLDLWLHKLLHYCREGSSRWIYPETHLSFHHK